MKPPTGCITPHFTWEEANDRQGNIMPSGIRPSVIKLASRLEKLRERCGFPLRINSWYRSPRHKVEAIKPRPGLHTTGMAVDIRCYGAQAHKLLDCALGLGWEGVGIQQSGPHKGRYIHLDMQSDIILPEGGLVTPARPMIWSY